MLRNNKKPNATVHRNAPVTRGTPSKRSTSVATTRSQSAAKRRRLDSSSAAEADVLLTDQGADTLTRAEITRIVDAMLRSLPHSSTVMPTNDAHDDFKEESLTVDPVDPSLDLHHVSLIQDNIQSVPPVPQTSRTTIFYKPTGAAIPPIPPGNLVEKIESGAFVEEMGGLLPNRLGLDDAAKSTQKHRLIINIMEWLQSFAVYVSVIARKQPRRVPDLMGYQVLILEASSEYKNECWMAYDRRFRQDATSQPQRSWSNIYTTLWLLAFPGQARANRCKLCFSLSHTSKDCELASVTRDKQPLPPSQYLYCCQGYSHQQHYRRLICYQWNE